MSENEINAFQFIVNQLKDIKEELIKIKKIMEEMKNGNNN